MLYQLIYSFLIAITGALLALFIYSLYFVFNQGRFILLGGVFLGYLVVDIALDVLGGFRHKLTNLLMGNTGSIWVLGAWLVFLLLSSLLFIKWRGLSSVYKDHSISAFSIFYNPLSHLEYK